MIYKKIIILIAMVLIFGNIGFSQFKGDQIFDNSTIHTIEFYSNTEPNLYSTLQEEADLTDYPYHKVRMVFDGQEVESVGLRVKGYFSTASFEQVPLKVDVGEYVLDQKFDGMKKFNLNNSYFDEERQRDRVAYELFKRAGIPAPRTAYAEVYVNDVFIKIYLLVQQVDKTFIKQNLADAGSLSKYGTEIKYGQDVFGSNMGANGEPILDLVSPRDYFKFQIINNILEASDNYPTNNFYIYYSDKEERYHFLPWDYNLCLGNYNGISLLEPQADYDAIWRVPEYKELYLEIACELYNYLLDEDFIDSLLDANFDIMVSNSQNDIVFNPNVLKNYIAGRKQWLLGQINSGSGMCSETFSYPFEEGDLVINEFIAKSDSLEGVQEPDGGTPDWIELYNNTNQDIILDHHFYLSNNTEFPKKWNFETPVTIPANGYQIIWADRDVHQQGVHASFKIGKSGGDLMLVYEDMTVIDHVEYEEQELNQGYARVPNGTGDFVIQDHTFDTNNQNISATSYIDNKDIIKVYPNPTDDLVYIESTGTIVSLQVYSVSGQQLFKKEYKNSHLDLRSTASGIYFLHIQTANNHEIVKLVKR